MVQNLDYIYVPKADINLGISAGTITKAALYFTKEYLFVLPFQSLQVLLAGMETNNKHMEKLVADINKQIPELDKIAFNNLMLSKLKPEWIYCMAQLDKFTIQLGFWIFGGIRLRKKGGELQVFNVQPATLRMRIKEFYGMA